MDNVEQEYFGSSFKIKKCFGIKYTHEMKYVFKFCCVYIFNIKAVTIVHTEITVWNRLSLFMLVSDGNELHTFILFKLLISVSSG